MTTRPQLRDDLLLREVDDELLIYDPRSGETLLLNGTAAAIAELCDGSGDANAIADEIVGIVEADRELVLADVEKVVGELGAKGLVVEAG